MINSYRPLQLQLLSLALKSKRKPPRVKKEKKRLLLRVKLKQPLTGTNTMSWQTSKEGLSNTKYRLYNGYNNPLLRPYLSINNFCNPPTLLPPPPQPSFATKLPPCINIKKVPSKTYKKTDSTHQPQSEKLWE